jgi:hypothetical protein
MTRRTVSALVLLVLVVSVSGCGAGKTADSRTPSKTTTTTTQTASSSVLEDAVRRAVRANHALLTAALLTNTVPAKSEGAAGPALADLRSAAAQRRSQRVKVRILSEKFTVTGVQLAPTYATATATILNVQRVQATYGRHRAAPAISREHVRLELHRIGNTDRFVVWKVAVLS